MLCRLTGVAALAFLVTGGRADACSICKGTSQPTFRQSAAQAGFVILAIAKRSRLEGDNAQTEFVFEQVVRTDPGLGKDRSLWLPGYIPSDPKKPARFLIFGNITDGRPDVFRGPPVSGPAVADYLRAAVKIDDRDRTKVLRFSFDHLDSADPDAAADAFLELAKATDGEIAALAPTFAPAKLRKLLKDPLTPADRLGLFAYLLGACGTKDDGDILAAMIRRGDDRDSAALSGLLGGLIELRPQQGWQTLGNILRDPKRPYSDKLAALGTLRFYHACKPAEHRKPILDGMAAVVENGDMADMAVEDLRRWRWWDLTKVVLAQYDKPSHAAPLVKRAIVRYAVTCPDPVSVNFIKARRQDSPALLAEVEKSLEFEKPAPPAKKP